jgi:hypothetical protein
VRAGARRLAPAAGRTPLRWGEDGRGPGLKLMLADDETTSSGLVSPPELRSREYPAARGRSVTHTSERAMWVCAPPWENEEAL